MRSMDTNLKSLKYRIRVLIHHPQILAEHITDGLGLKPVSAWTANTRRVTPTGRNLAGLHQQSMWCYSYDVVGKKAFSSEINYLLNLLEGKINFITSIVETGGEVSLIVNLPGDINIGDEISWQSLSRLAELKINLGFEVFPKY